MKKLFLFSGFSLLLLSWFLLLSPSAVLAQAKGAAAKGAAAKYVGSDACKGCHEDAFKSYGRSVHGKKAVPGNPAAGEGCESCHGPGSVHVDAGGGKGGIIAFKTSENSDMRSAGCLNCHENSTQLALWDSGIHKKKDVACNDCHSSHGGAKKPMGYGTGMAPLGYSAGPEYATCGKCHLNVKAQINRRSHHPIVEGRITCSNCHQPHGSMNPSQIREPSVNQLCYKCHAEKRGPFIFEHEPVAENCESCHTAHGGPHQKLLIEKVPNLCQGCHEATRHPATRYSAEVQFNGRAPNTRGAGRACLNCHINIHGSNAPGNPGSLLNSGPYFLR